MTVLITLTVYGSDTGPFFDLYSNVDGYTTPFETGVTKADLIAGYTSSVVPDAATSIRIQSTGVCDNYVDVAVTPITTTTTSSSSTSTTTTTTTVVCEELLISPNLLYSNISSAEACMSGSFVPYYGDTEDLSTTTVLYSGSCVFAPAGWYLDNNTGNWRYWDGDSFTDSGACGV